MKCSWALCVFFATLLAVAFSGCSEPRTARQAEPLRRDAVARERAAKDAAFRTGGESPIPVADREAFRGLSYYPLNPALRFTVKLERYPAPKQVRLGTNTGEIRRGLRYGYFDFEVEDRACRLNVYRLDEGSGGKSLLFMPFRDATSGAGTYAAGRYLELEENTSGVYEVDFNRAYNPYCAYNGEYSCPVPPDENTLRVPIRAGERDYAPPRGAKTAPSGF